MVGEELSGGVDGIETARGVEEVVVRGGMEVEAL